LGHSFVSLVFKITDTPHSVGLLRTRDQSDAGTSKWQNSTRTRCRNGCTRLDSKSQPQEKKRPQTQALDLAVTGIGSSII